MQILLGRQGKYLQGDGEMNAMISGIKGAQTPPPPWGASLFENMNKRNFNIVAGLCSLADWFESHFFKFLETPKTGLVATRPI